MKKHEESTKRFDNEEDDTEIHWSQRASSELLSDNKSEYDEQRSTMSLEDYGKYDGIGREYICVTFREMARRIGQMLAKDEQIAVRVHHRRDVIL